jgi:predicted NUDIX family phosphoesterase
MSNEQVYVVPRSVLFPDNEAPHGFFRADPAFFDRIYQRGHFAARDPVETDPSLKQIIPYAVVVRGDAVFLFRRSAKGGEQRLYGLRSVGVGGHVNPVDSGDVIHDALKRELEEELHLPGGWKARIVGLVNNDKSSVGSVHLGVVALVEAGPGDVRVREEDMMSGSFVSRSELLDLHARERESFEGWSALLLDRSDEVLPWPTGHPRKPPTRSAGSSTPTPSTTRTSTT